MSLASMLIKCVDLILQNTISDRYDHFRKNLRDKKEELNFKKKLQEFCDRFIEKHPKEIVSTSYFADYLEHYNIIEHVLDYYCSPSESACDYIDNLYSTARDIIEKNCRISPADRSIEEFHQGLYNIVDQYFLSKSSQENMAQLHVLMRNQTILEELKREIIPQKPTIKKKQYTLEGDPIPRKFSRRDHGKYIERVCPKNLFEICQKDKHIVLLDTAGAGKSVELLRVAAMASKPEINMYPLLFSLHLHCDQSIEEIVQQTYPEIDYGQLLLIFDGYDELLPQKSLEFARSVDYFVLNHPETSILISSRNNFYQVGDEKGKGATFENFKVYGLVPLSNEDIDAYVKSKDVSLECFWQSVNTNSLNDLVLIPFYLNHICELLQKGVVISSKSQLMNNIIYSLFEHDLRKYVKTTQELKEKKERILWQLGRMAFAMQCMHQKCITNTDYEVLMAAEPIDYASLIRYSGLFKKTTNETWEFEHNNFREYLAAKYLSGLELEDIKAVICVKDDYIKESWINVLSYLVVLYEEDSLLNWIIVTNPELVVSFEKDRISQNERTKIIIALLETWATRNVWLSNKYGHYNRITNFGQSEALIDYLLDRISNPKHFRERANALHILFFFTDKYGKEDKIRQVLFDFIQKDVGEEYGRYVAIETLGELQLHSPEITEYLISHLTKNHGDYELGVVKYISKHEKPGQFLSVLFEQYLLARKKSKSGHEWNICQNIEKIVLDLTSFEMTRDAFLFFAENSNNYSSYEEVLNGLTDNLILHYQAGVVETVDVIFQGWMIGAKEFNQKIRKCCFRFFVNTDTRQELIRALATHYLETEDYHAIFELEYCNDRECYIVLGESYRSDKNTYGPLFYEIASRMPEKNEFYELYATLLRENGIELPQKDSVRDYDLFRKQGSQIYFDSLFSKERYRELLHSMLKKTDTFDTCFSDEFWDKHYFLHPSNAEEYAYQMLTFDIRHMGDDPRLVRDLPDLFDNWDWYAINEIKETLRCYGEINVTDKQREYIETWCRGMLQEIDIKRTIKPWSVYSMTYALKQVIDLSNLLNIPYEREVFLDFLRIPKMYFNKQDKDSQPFASYVMSHLSDEDIQEQVQKNITARDLCLLSAREHLQYCQQNKLDFAVNYAREVCERTAGEFDIRDTALRYLIDMRGYEYVFDLFLDTEDDELFKCLIYATENIQNARLAKKLEAKNAESSDRTLYLSRLIRMQSKYALQTLCELLEEKMSVIRYRNDESTETITHDLDAIHDPLLLPELARLQAICFNPGFQDNGFFTLYETLRRTFVNVAKNDYKAVIDHLEASSAKAVFGSNEQYFCNSLLDDLRQTNATNLDSAWTLRDIKKYFQQHKGIMDY